VSAARCSGWSGPGGEEFALDKSASAGAEAPAELPTAVVGGTSRRNVLGAIASKRAMATSRERSDDNRVGAGRSGGGKSAGITAPNEPEEQAMSARRYRYGATQREAASA
jgi:hypothetical protein